MKKALKKRIRTALAAMLALSICAPLSALATETPPTDEATSEISFNTYDSRTKSVSADGHHYDVYTTLYYGSGQFKTSAWIEADGTVPANTMQINAYLLNEDKNVLKTSDWRTEYEAFHFHWSETPVYSGSVSGTYYSAGSYKIHHRSGDVTSGNMPSVCYDNGRLQDVGTITVSGAHALPVNEQGLTYGSVLDGSPDLISAVGIDGTSGYVRREELAPDLYTPEAQKAYEEHLQTDNLIPLYDLDGNRIGQFALAVPSDEPTDPFTQARIQELMQNAPTGADIDMEPVKAVYPFGAKAADKVRESLVNGGYPTNALGETYGTVGSEYIVGSKPDLIAVIGDSGVFGYIYTRVFERAAEGASTDVFDLQGNIVDRFSFGSGNTDQKGA